MTSQSDVLAAAAGREEPTTLAVVGERIDAITPGGDLDILADARFKLDWFKEQIRQLEAQWTERAIAFAEATVKGEIRIGPKLYWVGDEKQEKDLDVRKTTEALLNKTGGDVDSFCTCLSTNAFKPGATKKILGPELFAEHFSTTYKKKLKADGSPEKQLQCVNTDFLK